jgi:hypothetical protein
MPSLKLSATLVAVLCGLAATAPVAAHADGPAGHDPAVNLPLRAVPQSCWTTPSASDCVSAVIAGLDQARADLGEGAYALPAGFPELTPAQQMFVLTDLDRVAAGLAPIPGLTGALSADAAGGVAADDDPSSSDSDFGYWTANWAGGYPNALMAYYDWMYDDGPGSGNLDCTSANSGGCWGHRHDILWQFGGTGALAMGAAAGADPGGTPGYAILLGQGNSAYHPSYTYTWSQAVASGANGGSPGPASGTSTGVGGSGAATTTRRRPPAVATTVSRRHRARRVRSQHPRHRARRVRSQHPRHRARRVRSRVRSQHPRHRARRIRSQHSRHRSARHASARRWTVSLSVRWALRVG